MPTGGEIVVSRLAAEGVRHLYMVPGESFIAVLDALHDTAVVRPVTCRNEAGAAMMAEATGKLTGRPGVAIVTRGPGAANALAGVYVAHQDATAMVLLVGLPAQRPTGEPAFQDIDLVAVFGSVTKLVAIVGAAKEIDETLARAVRAAMFGRPGPVVIGLPQDVLFANFDRGVAPSGPTQTLEAMPAQYQIAAVKDVLAKAKRPLLIAGASSWSEDAANDLAAFAGSFDLPVIAAFRRQDRLDNRHPSYVGHAGIAPDAAIVAAFDTADVVIALGAGRGALASSGLALPAPGNSERRIVHIAPEAGDPDWGYAGALNVQASTISAIRALAGLSPPATPPPWADWRRALRASYLSSLEVPDPATGIRLSRAITLLRALLPASAIVTNGAGNYAAFVHRYYSYTSYPSQLAPISGSMGYGVPAAIAAKLTFPDRVVVALAGDGCFQMTGQELATAVQFGVSLVVIVVDNASLGTIRMHQEQLYPDRITATTLINPDFSALAASHGAWSKTVTMEHEFLPALEAALAEDRVSVIVLRIDDDVLAPRGNINTAR